MKDKYRLHFLSLAYRLKKSFRKVALFLDSGENLAYISVHCVDQFLPKIHNR